MGAGICLFWRLGNGILCTGTGIHEKQNNRKLIKNKTQTAVINILNLHIMT